jgi:hypothetical protein
MAKLSSRFSGGSSVVEHLIAAQTVMRSTRIRRLLFIFANFCFLLLKNTLWLPAACIVFSAQVLRLTFYSMPVPCICLYVCNLAQQRSARHATATGIPSLNSVSMLLKVLHAVKHCCRSERQGRRLCKQILQAKCTLDA